MNYTYGHRLRQHTETVRQRLELCSDEQLKTLCARVRIRTGYPARKKMINMYLQHTRKRYGESEILALRERLRLHKTLH